MSQTGSILNRTLLIIILSVLLSGMGMVGYVVYRLKSYDHAVEALVFEKQNYESIAKALAQLSQIPPDKLPEAINMAWVPLSMRHYVVYSGSLKIAPSRVELSFGNDFYTFGYEVQITHTNDQMQYTVTAFTPKKSLDFGPILLPDDSVNLNQEDQFDRHWEHSGTYKDGHSQYTIYYIQADESQRLPPDGQN